MGCTPSAYSCRRAHCYLGEVTDPYVGTPSRNNRSPAGPNQLSAAAADLICAHHCPWIAAVRDQIIDSAVPIARIHNPNTGSFIFSAAVDRDDFSLDGLNDLENSMWSPA
jgi:hypothetical protein